MSDDTPTQRLPETPAGDGGLVEERKKSRTLLYVLLGVGGALLIAIIVLVVVLLNGSSPSPTPTGSGSPSATPTASDSPSPTPTVSETPSAAPSTAPEPEPAPEPAPSAIVSYTVSTKDAGCTDDTGSVPLTFNWNTTGEAVDFAIGTDFAENGPYQTGLPAVGGITVNYQCSNASTKFSIAVHFGAEIIGRQTITVTK